MKLSCDVARDLLPLYHDGVCSDESRGLVEKHLQNCPDCSAILGELRGEIEIPHEEPNDGAVLKKLRKNVKQAWLRGAAAVLAAVVLVLGCWYARWYVGEHCYYRRFAQGQEPVVHGSVDSDGRTVFLYEVDENGEIVGAAENATNIYSWSEGGYDFHVCVPRWPGDWKALSVAEAVKPICGDIVPGQEVHTWLHFGRKEYAYYVGISVTTRTAVPGEEQLKTESETRYIILDENLRPLYPDYLDAKMIEAQDAFYEEYREEIMGIIQAAQAQWPFLAE